jgi:hypothetical protein
MSNIIENGVRELTIEERIRNLANPELTKSGTEADTIIQMLDRERAKVAEKNYRYVKELEREISQLRTEIRAIVGYIQYREA